MKRLLLFLSLLAISLSCSAVSTPVYDTDGHELNADTSYYVLPVVRGRGGGLTLRSHVLPCPLFVGQENREVDHGLPVRFTPQGTSDRVIRLSSNVHIRFAAVTTCVQSTEWHLSGNEPVSGRRHVLTGPMVDPEGTANVFRIEKYGGALDGYKLVSCRDSCKDLGVFRDGGKTWLGLADSVLVVKFRKAASRV